jgi:crossover junction endodeoxyribonuclease RusA
MEFFVPGVPVAKGSAKAFYNKKAGRAFVTQDNLEKQKPWVSLISVKAESAGLALSDSAVHVALMFNMPRPKAHFRSNGELKTGAPLFHKSKPDIDKLQRAVLDALSSIAFLDDRQVCSVYAQKMYSDTPGVLIKIEEWPLMAA